MSEMWNSRRGVFLAAAVLVLATVAAYGNSLRVPFLFDDIPSTVENPTIRRLWPIGPILLPPGHYAAVQRRPIINASLAVNYAMSGENPWSYHALQRRGARLWRRWCCSAIVRRTLLLPRSRDRFARAATPLAAAVALLWAVHPLLTDAVTYIIQRTEVLAGLFYLLTLYCTIRSDSAPRPERWYIAGGGGLRAGHGQQGGGLVGAAGRAALRSGIFERVVAGRVSPPRRTLHGAGRQLDHRPGPASPRRGRDEGVWRRGAMIEYPLAQPGVIAHYLGLCFWPHPLVLDYGFHLPETAWQIIPFAGADRRVVRGGHRRLSLPAVAGFSGRLVLCDPGAEFERDSAAPADRRRKADVPAAGGGCDRSGDGRIPGGAVVGPPRPGVAAGAAHRRRRRWSWLVALVLGVLTVRRNADYQSELSIWRDTVAKVPDNARAHDNLGLALAKRGRLDEAVADYRKTIELLPNYVSAYNNIGNVLVRRGQIEKAVRYYEEALRLSPDYASAHSNLGNVLFARGQINEAIDHYGKALESRPERESTYNNLGSALAARGQVDEAIGFFQKAVDLRPDYAEAHNNLGRALASRGRIDEAIPHFQAALRD